MGLGLTFLGTGGSVPTKNRSLPAIALNYEGQIILFDCGEGTQKQMVLGKIGFSRKMQIFITHLHGDHIFGIPGLLQTMSLLGRREKLEIFGPVGICNYVEAVKTCVGLYLRFPVKIKEIKAGIAYRGKGYKVLAKWAKHSLPNLAYAFVEDEKPGKFYPKRARLLGIPEGPLWHKLQHGKTVKLPNGKVVEPEGLVGRPRPGVKVVYTGDTSPCRGVMKLAEDADLLIHDSTFGDELEERAKTDWHSTPSQAAKIARDASVKKLILTHISGRYANTTLLRKQAAKTFKNVEVAKDFMHIEI
jgi:ribonuclease Z